MKLILIILSLFLFSCNRTTNENFLEFNIDLSYDNIGTIIIKDETCIWFAKRKFDPCVKIFNKKGEELQTTFLQNAEKKLGNITRVWVTHPDSIFVYSNYVNTIIILDKEGEIIEVNSFNDQQDEKGNKYEFYPPYGNIQPSDRIVFTTFILKKEYASEHGSWEFMSDFCEEMKSGYLLFCTGVQKNTGDSRFGLTLSQLRGFTDSDSILFLPFWQVIIANDRMFFTNMYERDIYLLEDELKISRILPVIPDSVKIKKPFKLTSTMKKEDEVLLLTKPEEPGDCYVNQIFYDKNKQIYIVILLESDVTTSAKKIHQINFYDSDFTLKKVKVIDDKEKYDGNFCFYMDSMLYIEKTDQQDGKRVFNAFEI